MNTIRPKTYHEIITFRRCVSLKTYLGGLNNKTLRQIYDYLIADTKHSIVISNGNIRFYAAYGYEPVPPISFSESAIRIAFSTIVLSSQVWNVASPYRGSGSGGDSGSSGNNNNNNNNNNNA